MIKIINSKSEFNKNLFTLITGTVVAQAIPIAVAPILTRIFTPEDFGTFAFYFAFVTVLAISATGRYELAIVLPKTRSHAYQLTVLSCIISSIVSMFVLLIIFLFQNKIIDWINNPQIDTWLYWIPLSIFFTGVSQSLYYWYNREKGYGYMAKSRVVQSSAMVVSQVGVGATTQLNAGGLIIGQLMGQLLCVCYMGVYFIKNTKSAYRPKKLKQLLLARRYINFPKFLLVAHTMSVTSWQLPSIFFNIIYTTTIAGFYVLIQRVIGVPLSIVGRAIADVFRQEARRVYSERGECTAQFKSTFIKLLTISVVPFTAFIIIAPDLFSVIFGKNWRIAGVYAQILTPMYMIQFVASPLGVIFVIAEKQNVELIWQISLFIITISALFIGYAFKDVVLSIALFSFAYSCMYTIYGALAWKYAKGIN